MNKPTIAIIGGGASGTIMAIHLINEFKRPFKIYMFEKRQNTLFRGAAYSSNLNFELLNVPAGKMSIFSDKPLDFYSWLTLNRQQESGVKITPESYVSRRWFGDYLSERLSQAIAASANAILEIVISEVLDITWSSSSAQYVLELDDKDLKKQADYLIFATGNEPPTDLLSNHEQTLMGNKYVANPWQGDPFQHLCPKDNVLIVGSGLSMVDHAISLYRRKHTGKIFSFSRHGLLPLVQQTGKATTVSFNLGALQVHDLFKQLRHQVRLAAEKGEGWQQVINAIRDHTPFIWKGLSVSSKQIFLQRLKHFWEIHRHRMPVESARLIDEMRAEGKLEILSGTRKPITVSNNDILFRWKTANKGVHRTVKISFIINCTGPSGNYSGYSNRLIKNLLYRGWMKQDALRLGIETGAKGEILMLTDTPMLHAYAIGPLRKACEWESTAIREIKMQAEQLALAMALYNKGATGY